jgi:nitronate monooxygenase
LGYRPRHRPLISSGGCARGEPATQPALGNSFLDTWHGNEAQLSASLPQAVDIFQNAVAAEDFDAAAIFVGEGVGLIRQVRPAADIVAEMVSEAAEILNRT